jgi:capsular exopolysaccharide synthesis family protein
LDPQAYQPQKTFADYVAILRVRKWLVLAVTAVFLLGGLGLIYLQGDSFSSSAQIFVNTQAGADPSVLPAADPATEAQVAASAAVAILAKPQLSTTLTPVQLLNHVVVKQDSAASVLTITFTGGTPAFAQAGAQAFATSYFQYKQKVGQDSISSQVTVLHGLIGTYSDRLAHLLRIAQSPTATPEQKQAAQSGVQTAKEQISSTQDRIAQLEPITPDPGSILGNATPAKDASTSPITILLASGFLGLILGSVLAFVLEGLSGKVRTAEDVERELDVQVLGVVPYVSGVSRRRDMLAAEVAPNSLAGESYRMLRSGVVYAAKDEVKVLMVTSSGVGEGKTTVAANLAVALAQADKRVLLVGGDLRRPEVHEYFGVSNERGLSVVLADDVEPPLVMTGVPNLRLLPGGPPVELSAHLFEGSTFPDLVQRLREAADFVVIDAPPLAISDPLIMAPHVDGIIFVVDMTKTDRVGLNRARDLLGRGGFELLGSVLNKYAGEYARRYGSGYYAPYRSKPAKPARSDGRSSRRRNRKAAQGGFNDL